MDVLKQFSPRLLRTDGEKLLDVDIVEKALGLSLPLAIKDILQAYDGAMVFEKNVSFPADDSSFADSEGMIDLEAIYGRGDGCWGIVSANKRYFDQLPKNSLAIGEVAGSNIIGIDLETGRVFLWLHDSPDIHHPAEEIFPSIDEFIESLTIRTIQVPEQLGVDQSRIEWKI